MKIRVLAGNNKKNPEAKGFGVLNFGFQNLVSLRRLPALRFEGKKVEPKIAGKFAHHVRIMVRFAPNARPVSNCLLSEALGLSVNRNLNYDQRRQTLT